MHLFFLIELNLVHLQSVFTSYTMGTFDESLLTGRGSRPFTAPHDYILTV